jgi:hypothetical protein
MYSTLDRNSLIMPHSTAAYSASDLGWNLFPLLQNILGLYSTCACSLTVALNLEIMRARSCLGGSGTTIRNTATAI